MELEEENRPAISKSGRVFCTEKVRIAAFNSTFFYKDCRLSPVEALSITPTLLFPEYVTSTDTLASQWVTLHFPGRGNKSRENFIHLFA